jgi:hypothetical protein
MGWSKSVGGGIKSHGQGRCMTNNAGTAATIDRIQDAHTVAGKWAGATHGGGFKSHGQGRSVAYSNTTYIYTPPGSKSSFPGGYLGAETGNIAVEMSNKNH